MIRVTIHLDSAITGKTTKLGEMRIWNTATGTRQRRNYKVAVCRKGHYQVPKGAIPKVVTRCGEVVNYPSEALNVWRLIARALLSAFPEEVLKDGN